MPFPEYCDTLLLGLADNTYLDSCITDIWCRSQVGYADVPFSGSRTVPTMVNAAAPRTRQDPSGPAKPGKTTNRPSYTWTRRHTLNKAGFVQAHPERTAASPEFSTYDRYVC